MIQISDDVCTICGGALIDGDCAACTYDAGDKRLSSWGSLIIHIQ
jgi:hypothetical protein